MGYLGRTPTPSPVTIDDIPANSIDASKIVDGSIEVSDIKDNSITDAKLNSTKLDGIADSANNYTHPAAHTVSEVTGLQGLLDGKVDDSQVLTNVPSGALFTDTNTIYTHPAAHSVSEVTGLQGLLDGKTTETYVNTKVAALVASSPATLDTLNELAAALGNDPNFATTVTNSIGTKLPLAGGTMTGTIAGFTSTGIDDNATSTAITIDASENVGIGTSSPQAKLHINSSTSDGIITRTTANVEPFIALQRNSGSNGVVVLRGTEGGHLYLDTGATGASQSTKMVVTASGNVGIGTISPVPGTNQTSLTINAVAYPNITLQYGGNSTGAFSGDSTGVAMSAYDARVLKLSTNSAERMRIDSAGNVGIGTSTPKDMHATGTTLAVKGAILSGDPNGAYAGPRNTRDWFVYSGPGDNTGNYVHMKTNLDAGVGGVNTEHTMSCFTYHSYYAYGGLSGQGTIGWHNWSGSFYNTQKVNNGALALVQSSYVSTDGFVVLVALLGAGYAQFSIDWNQWAGYSFRERKVTASGQHTAATGLY